MKKVEKIIELDTYQTVFKVGQESIFGVVEEIQVLKHYTVLEPTTPFSDEAVESYLVCTKDGDYALPADKFIAMYPNK